MESIQLIRANLEQSEDIVLAAVEDMREHCMVFPTTNGGCHTLWVLGHLAYIEAWVVRTFMRGAPNPLEHWKDVFDGGEVSGDVACFPTFGDTLEACRAERAVTMAVLDTLTEEDLDQPSSQAPEGTGELFGTYRRCLQYTANHWFMHRGQIADARRAAGLARAWY